CDETLTEERLPPEKREGGAIEGQRGFATRREGETELAKAGRAQRGFATRREGGPGVCDRQRATPPSDQTSCRNTGRTRKGGGGGGWRRPRWRACSRARWR